MDYVEDIDQTFHSSEQFKNCAHISNIDDYHRIYDLSIQEPDTFWLNIAKQFYWHNGIKSDPIFSYNFDVNNGPIDVQFMKGSKTNACFNLVDRVINSGLGHRIAYYW
jgi:acetyl-CoA synthetase